MHPIPHNFAIIRWKAEVLRSALASPFREALVESFNGQRVQPCFRAARRFSISLSFQHLGCFKCTASLSFCVSNKNQRCCGITNFKLSMSKHEETLSSSDWIRSLTCHFFPFFLAYAWANRPKRSTNLSEFLELNYTNLAPTVPWTKLPRHQKTKRNSQVLSAMALEKKENDKSTNAMMNSQEHIQL